MRKTLGLASWTIEKGAPMYHRMSVEKAASHIRGRDKRNCPFPTQPCPSHHSPCTVLAAPRHICLFCTEAANSFSTDITEHNSFLGFTQKYTWRFENKSRGGYHLQILWEINPNHNINQPTHPKTKCNKQIPPTKKPRTQTKK